MPAKAAAAPTAPAQAKVDVRITQQGNRQVSVAMRNVSPPSNAHSGARAYVVWAKQGGGDARNLGTLRVDRSLNGSFVALTPMQEFELFVTSEPDASTRAPSGPQLLSTRVHTTGF